MHLENWKWLDYKDVCEYQQYKISYTGKNVCTKWKYAWVHNFHLITYIRIFLRVLFEYSSVCHIPFESLGIMLNSTYCKSKTSRFHKQIRLRSFALDYGIDLIRYIDSYRIFSYMRCHVRMYQKTGLSGNYERDRWASAFWLQRSNCYCYRNGKKRWLNIFDECCRVDIHWSYTNPGPSRLCT